VIAAMMMVFFVTSVQAFAKGSYHKNDGFEVTYMELQPAELGVSGWYALRPCLLLENNTAKTIYDVRVFDRFNFSRHLREQWDAKIDAIQPGGKALLPAFHFSLQSSVGYCFGVDNCKPFRRNYRLKYPEDGGERQDTQQELFDEF
jgi:hypothetical protein